MSHKPIELLSIKRQSIQLSALHCQFYMWNILCISVNVTEWNLLQHRRHLSEQ